MKSDLNVGDLVEVCNDFVPTFPEPPLVGKVGVIVATMRPVHSPTRHEVLVDGVLSVCLENELIRIARSDSYE
jgi:hypothetical protein